MQTSREIIHRTIEFNNPERLGRDFPQGTDFYWAWFSPSPDDRPNCVSGVDEWGAVWENIGVCMLGEVKEFPLKSWEDFPNLRIPDIREERRYGNTRGARQRAGDKFLIGNGVSLYERVHFLRGLENTWADIYEAPEKLCGLIDILVDMNLHLLGEYAKEGFDGFFFCDDWGLQNQLMISPEKWREIWKPRYAKVYGRARELGIKTFLHSCGYIVEILDDLIDAGLDVIQIDQQENMGLELLGRRFAGRVTFFCDADIQTVLPRGNPDEVRAYCRKMVKTLGTPHGGFIARHYCDPVGAGHPPEAVNAMCDEFVKISRGL